MGHSYMDSLFLNQEWWIFGNKFWGTVGAHKEQLSWTFSKLKYLQNVILRFLILFLQIQTFNFVCYIVFFLHCHH